MAAVNSIRGLSESEVTARRARGQGNNVKLQTGRSYVDILRQNVFTFINIVLFSIGAVLVALGRVGDAVVSVGLILLNVVIGVYQEARAKRQLDQIALLTRPKAAVIRDGVEKTLDPSELVIGDAIVVRAGDQIVVDGKVLDGKIDADESLLTGESDLIPKQSGDQLLSGSFAVTGQAIYEATQVGAESFANKLTASARAFRVVKTPLQRDVDFVIRLLMGIAMFIGFLLLISVILYSIPLIRSVQMASVIAGLVPNGLFFMVIVAYAMGALRIVQRGALIQQSNSVESLSNVQVLCMDKTGTLTANKINFYTVHPITLPDDQLRATLGDFAHSASSQNKTGEAIAAALTGEKRNVVAEVAFSSARKWSALAFDDPAMRGVYVLGAIEMIAPSLRPGDEFSAQVQGWSNEGLRVLLFAHQPDGLTLYNATEQPALPDGLIPLGLIAFTDELRPQLKETLQGFAEAGIRLKVISGDNPYTVAALAKQAGFVGDLQAVSGTELAVMTDAEFEQAAHDATIFGRITPQQKEKLVDSLIKRGAYVAMIGDGVNDVLSLKKANLGIAMQSGSAATRGVADMVLLNDSFGALPPAFLEGQRIINGMQDILRLFLTRALYVSLLILSIAVVDAGFPYVPKHVSLLTLLTVGVPTFALAAWARPGRVHGRLLRSVTHFVFPAAISIFVFALLLYVGYFIAAFNATLNVEVTPDDIREFQTYANIAYDIATVDDFRFESASIVARTALTTFTTLAGLMLIIFVEPPHPFFVGGDVLSPDKRPTYLALGCFLAFIVFNVYEPARRFFELIVLKPTDYLIIGLAVLTWALILRQAWRHDWFERFLGLGRASST
ncbi:MAG: HAD-IC family P-type ATPase [Chloroflexi bacterium]|uniref:HAD-IC family P-type ATPase n=1 Tax=Candidatus Flexifilum breve TaxID=3140694 RepID=UPI0031354F03|nr:HAD-IC family P-type ATPase [Chloroflexota bacterium]